MAAAREVVVLSGVRTPVGNYGGSLKDFSPATLGAMVIQEAGGSESMSRGAYLAENHRWGQRMGNSELIDAVTGGLTDPFDDYPMGITAENVAAKWGISREDQDALAVESHRRAAQATAGGYFKEQILPVEVKSRKGSTVIDHHEHIRAD